MSAASDTYHTCRQKIHSILLCCRAFMLSGDFYFFFHFLPFASASPAEMCAVRTRCRLLEQRFDSVCADCGLAANNVQLCQGRGGSDCQFVKLSRADGALLCWAEVCTPHKKIESARIKDGGY